MKTEIKWSVGVGEGRWECGEDLCDPLVRDVGKKRVCSRWSAIELGVKLGVGFGGEEGAVKICN